MKKILIPTILLLLGTTMLRAQQDDTYNESVVVKGSYNPEIEMTEKLYFPAVITDSLEMAQRTFQYSISPIRLKSLYEPSRIKAARIKGEPMTKLYNNYFRLGLGNYWTQLADLYWNSTRDTKKTYGVRINHKSSWDKLPDYGPNHFEQTGITLFGKYIFADRLQLSSDISYEHDHNLYYGFTDSMLNATLGKTRKDIGVSDYRAKNNVVTWNIGIRNMQLDKGKLGYSANMRISDLWASYGQNEFNLNLEGDIHYGFGLLRDYKGIAYLHVEWDGYASHDRLAEQPLGYIPVLSDDTVSTYRNIVKINPYIDFMFSGLQFHTGFTSGWDGFTSDDSVTFRFFPDMVVSKNLMKDALVISVGATGGFDANNWNTIRIINPYVTPGSEQRATRHYDFAGYVRWSISKKLEANAGLSYQMLYDDISFTLDNNYALNNVYKPYYIDNNRFIVGTNIAFANDEVLKLVADGHYYKYNVTDDVYTQLLYRPDWDFTLAADVNYHDKWFFHLEGQLLGRMKGDINEILPMRYGVNAEVEYRHNRALSFFIKIDNMAFQRYYYWTNYPSQRGLFILGLTYTIPHQ